VEVVLEQKPTLFTVRAHTGPDGQFHLFALPAAAYRIEFRKEGFRTLLRENLELPVGDRVALDLVLEIGDFAQVMDVTAPAPLIQTAKGTVSFLAGQTAVTALPLDGRNFVSFLSASDAWYAFPAGKTRFSAAGASRESCGFSQAARSRPPSLRT
jgi:hypothetical protein